MRSRVMRKQESKPTIKALLAWHSVALMICVQVENRSTFQAPYQLLLTRGKKKKRTAGMFQKIPPWNSNFKDTLKSFRKYIKFHTKTITIVSPDQTELKHSCLLPFKVWATAFRIKLSLWLKHPSSHVGLLLEAFGAQFSKHKKNMSAAKTGWPRYFHSSAEHTKLAKNSTKAKPTSQQVL